MQNLFGSATPNAPQYTDVNPYVLGTRFQADIQGSVVGLRFYKTAAMVGVHNGGLYDSFNNLMGSLVFVNETNEGWQTQNFASPIQIQAGILHTAAITFTTPDVYIQAYPVTGTDNGNLHTDNTQGGYVLSANLAAPTTFGAYNFYVDVDFSTTLPPPTPIPPSTTATDSSRTNNTLSFSTISALGTSITNAMANGFFKVDVFYLLSGNEIPRITDYLASLGYTTELNNFSGDVWRITIRWNP